MIDSAESAFVRRRAAGDPMLMECDFHGRLIWMSQRTRDLLCNPTHLTDVLRCPEKPQAAFQIGNPLQFWLVWEFRDRIVIGAQAVRTDSGETGELQDVQRRLSLHFIQLLEMERRLAASVQFRQGKGARRAARQIELERQRLGRELHTGVGQLLAAIRLQLEIIALDLPTPPGTVGQALDNISILATDTMEQVRSLSRRLHPPEWQRLTLSDAIRQLWALSGVPERFQAAMKIEPGLVDPDLDVKILIYRGLQEALSNMVRHSGATRAGGRLHAREDALVLEVWDNGIGFDPEAVFSAPAAVASGIGLRSLQDTAQELGGKLEIESGPDGTKLIISVAPFPAAAE